MNTKFNISAIVASDVLQPMKKSILTPYRESVLSHAEQYAQEHLPGYEVLPHGQQVASGQWRFEAINNSTHRGAVISVNEVWRS